jgi:hypothetical protein
MTLEEAIKHWKPQDEFGFRNGWQMWPNWWSTSTDAFKAGYLARKVEDLEKKLAAQETASD